MLQLLLTCWPILALLYVPRLAQLVAVVVAARTRSRLDHRIPDELPQTAAAWLAERLPPGVTAVVTDREDDAYSPRHGVIQLHDTTAFKADPVYWATAAHELGHARLRRQLPIVGHLRTAAAVAVLPLLAAGVALLAGHLLYALPRAAPLAFVCFTAAAATRIFVLLDEALASVLAYQELRASDAVDFAHLRAIRAVLVTAFLTYFVTYASYALLLAQWPLLDAVAWPVASHELTALGWAAAVLLTGATVAAWTRPAGRLRWLPVALLVVLVWDVIAPAYAWCVLAALAATWHAWHGLALAPLALPFAALARFVRRFSGPGLERSWRFIRERARGAEAVAAGNRWLAKQRVRDRLDPWWVERLVGLGRFASLPLLIAIWL